MKQTPFPKQSLHVRRCLRLSLAYSTRQDSHQHIVLLSLLLSPCSAAQQVRGMATEKQSKLRTCETVGVFWSTSLKIELALHLSAASVYEFDCLSIEKERG